jgi:4-amino-4-deoxy-L-arabinose transferase-like glycosyltransferase
LLRIAYLEKTTIPNPIIADAREYVTYGYNLAQHGTFSKEYPADNPIPDNFRSPGFPVLVAIGFQLGGSKGYYPFVRYTQAVLGTFLVPLTYILGTFFLSPLSALVVSFLVAINPHLISFSSYILAETLFSFFLLISILLLYLALRSEKIWLFLLSGAMFGITYLVNESILFLPWFLAAAIFLCIRKENLRNSLKPHLIRVVGFLIVFSVFGAAWSLRNTINVPDLNNGASSRARITMAHGTYPDFIYKNPKLKYFPYRDDPEFGVYVSSWGNFASTFWERFKGEPVKYVTWYMFKKPYYIWSWSILQGQGDVYIYPVWETLYTSSKAANRFSRLPAKLIHIPTLLLCLMGLAFSLLILWKKPERSLLDQGPMLVFVSILHFTLLYMAFASLPRYSVPLRPELYLGAMWALTWLFKRFGTGKIDLTQLKASNTQQSLDKKD